MALLHMLNKTHRLKHNPSLKHAQSTMDVQPILAHYGGCICPPRPAASAHLL